MKIYYSSFLVLLLMPFICVNAQEKIAPGVSESDWNTIQTQVTSLLNNSYQVAGIVNVDSAIGNRFVADGAITNPYATLSGCYIFTTQQQDDTSSLLHGTVGVYKNGNITWQSNSVMINATTSSMPSISAVRDLNTDGKVDIITSWFSGATANVECLWIFSWDGQTGTLINAVDDNNESVLISLTSGFEYVDVNGDNIYEIMGNWYANPSDEQTQKIVYSWNGSLYGKWASSPQPLPSGFYPRDKVDAKIKAVIKNIGGKFSYQYSMQNNQDSKQAVNELTLLTSPDSVANDRSPAEWLLGGIVGKALGWVALPGFNRFIKPNSSDTSFYFESNRQPAIVQSLVRGDNGYWSSILGDTVEYTLDQWLDEAKSNSFKVSTIGPSNPPTPFIPINFLDTLTNYTTQSRTLGWIKDQATANKYLGYFVSAKTSLGQNNIKSTRTTLQQVLQDVNVDSTNMLTSEAYALIRYNTEYLLAQMPTAPPSVLFVKLVNSADSLLTIGTLQYRDSTWKDATNNNDGTFTITTTRKKLNLRMTYEYGTQTKSNVTIGSDTVIFQTKNVVVNLQTSSGNPLDTGIVQYNSGGWRDFGITTNGVVVKELLPIKYKFKMTYNNANNEKTQNIDSNAIVIFRTVNANVQLKNSSGNFIDQGTVQYNSGGWKDFGIMSNGSVHKELLPAKYNFKMTYAFASKNQAQDLDSNAVVVFQTSNVSVQLKSSQGTPLDTGVVQYNAGGWKDFGTTANGVANKELLPVKYTFRMTYGYANNEKAQNTDSNAVVTFRRSMQ
jgi:hypothetical protein